MRDHRNDGQVETWHGKAGVYYDMRANGRLSVTLGVLQTVSLSVGLVN